MSWKKLLDQRRVAPEPATREELADLRELAARALDDATLDAPLSPDGRFERAYAAARVLATMVVRASGYRVKAAGGAHYTTFLALEAADPGSFARFAAYFNLCREKRNELAYVAPDRVSSEEVVEILREVPAFRDLVERWLRSKHPELGG